MRVVIDTNILVSALAFPDSVPADVLRHWREGRYTLLASEELLNEIRRVTRYPKLRQRLSPPVVGALVNEIRDLAEHIPEASLVDASSDPFDNFLLALAQTGAADFLVTGDKEGLLVLKNFGRTRIVTARQFLNAL